jgi:hypothetical protein
VLSVDDARSSLALALYAIAASRTLHRDCRQVELHHLPSGQVFAWTHTGESLARHLRRAEEVAEECAAADERMRAPLPAASYDEVFPPKPSPGCGWCDYQRFCPEGQQAAKPHRPWDALAELLRGEITASCGGQGKVKTSRRGLGLREISAGTPAEGQRRISLAAPSPWPGSEKTAGQGSENRADAAVPTPFPPLGLALAS